MSFSEIMARRQFAASSFYSRREDGQNLTVWFPDAAGTRPGSFPNAILCHMGTVSSADRDLMTGVDRRVRNLAISFVTSELPAAFRQSLGLDKIQVAQPVKVGYEETTAILYTVKSATSASGITQLELDQQL